jgi:acyl-CoA thioesterase
MTEESTRETIIRTRFAADPYIASQGFILEEVLEGEISVATIVRPDQTNSQGSTHGGVFFSLADCAFSLACNAYSESALAIDTHMV